MRRGRQWIVLEDLDLEGYHLPTQIARDVGKSDQVSVSKIFLKENEGDSEYSLGTGVSMCL